MLLARPDSGLGTEVVLKILLAVFREDPSFERMFEREARTYARLNHPNIVRLVDFFSASGQLVMVLEYIDGLSLHRLRNSLTTPMADRAALYVAKSVFAALAVAHAAKDPLSDQAAPVIHRDVNPSNVLLSWKGEVKLADFGIAKVTGVTGETQTGFIKGTFGYMAPEQVRGDSVDANIDIYAATLLLWELLTKRRAYDEASMTEIDLLKAMANPKLPSLDSLRPDLSRDLRELVARGLEPDPKKRTLTALEATNFLKKIVRDDEGQSALAEVMARAKVSGIRYSNPPPAAASTEVLENSQPIAFDVPEKRAKIPSKPPPPRKPLHTPTPSPASSSVGSIRKGTLVGVPLPSNIESYPPEALEETTNPASKRAEELIEKSREPTPSMLATTEVQVGSLESQLRASKPSTSLEALAAAVLPNSNQTMPPSAPAAPPTAVPISAASLPNKTLPLGSSLPPLAPPVASPLVPAPDTVSSLADAPATVLDFPPTERTDPGVPALPSMRPRLASAAFTHESLLKLDESRPKLPEFPLEEKGKSIVVFALVGAIASLVLIVAFVFLRKPDEHLPDQKQGASESTVRSSAALDDLARATPTGSEVPAAAVDNIRPTPSLQANVATPSPNHAASAPAPKETATQNPSQGGGGTGTVIPPKSAKGHRVFMDGRQISEGAKPFQAKCGVHQVKIGSRGKERSIDIPCGGEVSF